MGSVVEASAVLIIKLHFDSGTGTAEFPAVQNVRVVNAGRGGNGFSTVFVIRNRNGYACYTVNKILNMQTHVRTPTHPRNY